MTNIKKDIIISLVPCISLFEDPTRMDLSIGFAACWKGAMKERGYREWYIYDHDTPQGFSGQNYFPKDISCGIDNKLYAKQIYEL